MCQGLCDAHRSLPGSRRRQDGTFDAWVLLLHFDDVTCRWWLTSCQSLQACVPVDKR